METFSVSDFHYLIFVIPGFATVWAFRYFTKSEKRGDFELVGLGFFWGLIVLVVYETYLSILPWLNYSQEMGKLLKNIYSASLVLSLFGIILGFIGAIISKRKFYKKITQFLFKMVDKF